jgi:hypothetical protein
MLFTIEKFVRIILELVLLKFLGALTKRPYFPSRPSHSLGLVAVVFILASMILGEETTRLGRRDVEHRSCSRKALRPRQARLLRASFGGGISPAIPRGAGRR